MNCTSAINAIQTLLNTHSFKQCHTAAVKHTNQAAKLSSSISINRCCFEQKSVTCLGEV